MCKAPNQRQSQDGGAQRWAVQQDDLQMKWIASTDGNAQEQVYMPPAPDGISGHCETIPPEPEIRSASSFPGPQEHTTGMESSFGVSFQLDQEKVCASVAGSGSTASH